MTISYPLTPPSSPSTREVAISIMHSVAISSSPWSFSQQVQDWGGQILRMEVSLPQLSFEEAMDWEAFLMALRGQKGTFYFGLNSGVYPAPRGTVSGIPVVNGAGQTGNVLNVGGFTPSESNVLKAGDWFELNNRLYRNLKDVNSDGSGNATLDISPRLRIATSNGEALNFTEPKGLWRLDKNDNPILDVSVNKYHALSFSAIEAI